MKVLKQNGNIRLITYAASSGTCLIFEIQKRHWLFPWVWKTQTFNGLDWFADEQVVAMLWKEQIIKQSSPKQ